MNIDKMQGNGYSMLVTKADKKEHGIGLNNIKNTAQKYYGGVDWSVENKKFTLTVMLQNEKF